MIALACALLGVVVSARAEVTSYHVPHPVGWMNAAPVGEAPGWSAPRWFNLEVSQSNVWNVLFNMQDRRTGDTYQFEADYEQTTAVITTGFQLSPRLAFSLEVPYANHNGGFLDDFIDQFHQVGQFDRFSRPEYGKFNNSFIIRKNGVNALAGDGAEGVANLRAKLKYWMWQWRSSEPGACECGFSLGVQSKFPTQKRDYGLTSGRNDYTAAAFLGAPLFKGSGVWMTGAVSKNAPNPLFNGWPEREWQQMYELTLNIGLEAGVSLLLQARTESPIFEQKYLRYVGAEPGNDEQPASKDATAWYALTEWRVTQIAGLQVRWGKGSSASFSILEDWGLGDRDSGSWNYTSGTPDVAFITQWHFLF